MMDKLPTISVIIATFNSERTIERCLRSVRSQEYPQEKIDIILADGGSSDKTLKIVKQFNPKIIHIKTDIQNAEYNRGFGIRKASGDLILMIDHDNILPHNRWFRKMVQPLFEHPEVVGVHTWRYHYDRNFPLLDRYGALFGTTDPVTYYLAKADRLSYLSDKYNLLGKATDYGDYYIVQFEPDRVSTIGANGFLIRRGLLIKYAQVDETHCYHTDINVDLIRQGFNKYAFIKDDIIHLTSYKSIWSFLYRRQLFLSRLNIRVRQENLRRYNVYTSADRLNLFKFILISVTFVVPTYDATRGFLKIHDPAWFLHPLLSFTFLVMFSFIVTRDKVSQYVKKILA